MPVLKVMIKPGILYLPDSLNQPISYRIVWQDNHSGTLVSGCVVSNLERIINYGETNNKVSVLLLLCQDLKRES